MELEEQIKETWNTSNRVNLLLIKSFTEEALNATLSKRGGRTVGMQLAHILDVRINWLEVCNNELSKTLKKIPREDAHKKDLLVKSFNESAKAIEKLIEISLKDKGKIKGFKKGLVPFLGYMISHEAHHRGHILLTLKQCGIKVDDKVKWGMWEWNKV